jgi:hypothetical protein
MLRKKEYIASPNYLTDMYSNPCYFGGFQLKTKVSIDTIKIDKKYFAFQNKVNEREVDYMAEHFYIGAWYPIIVNKKNYLLDGQHRIAAAKKMNLKYIDVVVEDRRLLMYGKKG